MPPTPNPWKERRERANENPGVGRLGDPLFSGGL